MHIQDCNKTGGSLKLVITPQLTNTLLRIVHKKEGNNGDVLVFT